MTSLWEAVLVSLVVGVALVWAVWAIWRYLRGDGTCSSCSSGGGCAGKAPQKLVEDLAPISKAAAGATEAARKEDNHQE